MTRNVGNGERIFRVVAAMSLAAAAAFSPMPQLVWTRMMIFLTPAIYLAWTALSGTCLGYAMMGKSTCAMRLPR